MIEVNVIGLQAPQAGFDGVENVLARQPRVVRTPAHRVTALGRQDEVVAFAFKPAPDDCFGAPDTFERHRHRIDIRRVNEIDAALGGLVHDGK